MSPAKKKKLIDPEGITAAGRYHVELSFARGETLQIQFTVYCYEGNWYLA